MNERRTELAVIGAGSAGLSAFREARRHTDNVLLIDPGPLGTTCARVGCMPSKALIYAADTFHRRRFFDDLGIAGSGMLVCDPAIVLKHVRRQRGRFVDGMVDTTRKLAGDRLICARAKFLDEHRIQAGEEIIRAERIILAVGAEPVVPDEWRLFGNRVLTSETVFEQDMFPQRIAVIGLGPIGLELGQALSRMGLNITGWEWMLVLGLLIGAVTASLLSGTFEWEWVPPVWEESFGSNVWKRLGAALAGGILIGFGARWGCGCTSGHGISGSLQLVLASWLSGVLFFVGGIASAFLLYRIF